MPRTKLPFKPVFTLWYGSWQVRVERRPLMRVLKAAVGALPFADASFDLVIVAQVLEYLPGPFAALAEMRHLLRPGRLIRVTSSTATVPNASAGIAGKEFNR